MGCGSRPWARAKPLAARYITHSKFNRAINPAFPIVSKERDNPSSENVSTIMKSPLGSVAMDALWYIISSRSAGEMVKPMASYAGY
jgi:hypothetical protein